MKTSLKIGVSCLALGLLAGVGQAQLSGSGGGIDSGVPSAAGSGGDPPTDDGIRLDNGARAALPNGAERRRVGPPDNLPKVSFQNLPRGVTLVLGSAQGSPLTEGGQLAASAALLAVVPVGADGSLVLDLPVSGQALARAFGTRPGAVITLQVVLVPHASSGSEEALGPSAVDRDGAPSSVPLNGIPLPRGSVYTGPSRFPLLVVAECRGWMTAQPTAGARFVWSRMVNPYSGGLSSR